MEGNVWWGIAHHEHTIMEGKSVNSHAEKKSMHTDRGRNGKDPAKSQHTEIKCTKGQGVAIAQWGGEEITPPQCKESREKTNIRKRTENKRNMKK